MLPEQGASRCFQNSELLDASKTVKTVKAVKTVLWSRSIYLFIYLLSPFPFYKVLENHEDQRLSWQARCTGTLNYVRV